MTDPDIRRRLREASPLFLVSSDDPPALVVGAGPAETALIPPEVPATINDPHSAWHGALLADALRHAGAEVVARLGPDVGKDPQADAAAIVDFLRKHLRRGALTCEVQHGVTFTGRPVVYSLVGVLGTLSPDP